MAESREGPSEKTETQGREGEERPQQALSCKLIAEEGMDILELSAELIWNLRGLFRTATEDSPAAEDR